MAFLPDEVYGCGFCGEVDGNFQCHICLGVMWKPVTLTCGHSGCLNCLEQLSSTNAVPKCPVCRTRMPDRLMVNVCLDQLARKLQMKCRNEGCGWSGGYGEAKTHGAHCAKALMKCGNAGCDVETKREQMAAHKTTCPKQAVPCPKCNESIARELLPRHEAGGCYFTGVECPLGCGERFPRCHIHVHQQKCQRRVTECDVKGCKAIKRHSEKESHDQEAASSHKRLQYGEIQRLRRLINEKISHQEKVAAKDATVISFQWEIPHFKETICTERRRLPQYQPLTSRVFAASEGLRLRGVIQHKKDYHIYVQAVAAVDPFIAEVRIVLRPGEPQESIFELPQLTIEAGKSAGKRVDLEKFVSINGELRVKFIVIIFNLIAS